MNILTYDRQLKMLANENKVDLLDAVKAAGLPTSTYYRAKRGDFSMRLATAEAIAKAIKELAVH